MGPLARFARAIGVEGPVSVTCEPYRGTGHKMSNYLCEPGWGLEWPWSDVINHIHCGTIAAFDEWYMPPSGRRFSVRKHYAISDDGIGFSGINSVPDEERGVCSEGREFYGTWVGPKCSGSVAYRVRWVQRLAGLFGERLRMVELMPQRHHNRGYRLNDLDDDVDLGAYERIAQEVWGVSVRRALD